MGIVFRQSAKTSIVVLAGNLLGAVIIWLSTKYIVDKQDFGFTRNLTNNAVILSQLLLLGMNSTLYVFTHRFSGNAEKRKVLATICLSIPLVAMVLFSVAYLLLKEWILQHFQPGDIPLMRAYFVWLVPYTLLMLYLIILEQYLGSQMKVAISAFMREVVLRLLNLALILLFAFGYIDFSTLVIGTALCYIIPVVILLNLCFRTEGFGLSFQFHLFTKAEYKEMLVFAWYHFLLSISIMFMSALDANLLPFYDKNGFNSVAVYTIAVYIISFLQLPSRAFLPASFSILTKAFTDNDVDKARDIFKRASENLLIATMAIGMMLVCNLDNATAVIGNGRNYADMVPIVMVLMGGQLVNIATGMNDQVLSITNYYKFTFYVSIAITVLLYGMLRWSIPHYGIYGAAWSSTIAIIVFNVVKLIFINSRLQMIPFSGNTVLILICALPALAAGYFMPRLVHLQGHMYIDALTDVAIRSAVIMVVYVLMLLWLRPSQDMITYLANVKKNKRLF